MTFRRGSPCLSYDLRPYHRWVGTRRDTEETEEKRGARRWTGLPEATRLINGRSVTVSIFGRYLIANLIFPYSFLPLARSSCIPNIFLYQFISIPTVRRHFSDSGTRIGTCSLSSGQLGVKRLCSLTSQQLAL